MSRAFVKEAQDETAPRCPRCQATGRPVGPATLAGHLEGDAGAGLGASACFCGNSVCDVAYYDANGQTAPVGAMRCAYWPKSADPAALLCPCLGLTAGDIIEDAKHNDPSRVKRALAEAHCDPARCVVGTAYAQPCTGELQRLYLKHRVV